MNRLELIAEESAAFARAVTGNLDARVPSCPEWQVGDLVAHLGSVQRFHARHVVRGVTDDPDRSTPISIPEDDADLVGWFDEGTRVLLAALEKTGTDTPAWSFGPPRTSAFWHRRMALEAAVHRWDAETARADARGFDRSLAEDGIDEVLTVHTPSDLAEEPTGVRGVVQVRLTDSGRTWTVEITGDDLVPATEKTPDAVLEGTASGVFLALWGRVPLSSLTTEGDESQVAALRTG